MGSYLTTLIPLAFLLASVGWVYQDASLRTRRGTPVYFSAGSIEVSKPATWALGCLCLWLIFMPLYLTCRRPGN
ncbi:hypothetical protein [Streptacidiphilus fuscans]|uniref:SRCR domain-containing protein n=1 Tax=Streptacidiphilus fuscans TaxID=2789292 RepID=A0A931B926_9ACTN|nr:hypothetical protein [Streptacidiphilus fuscans]MBF9072759.1 hypothetical protein [Streptacidiphilus fuscans]